LRADGNYVTDSDVKTIVAKGSAIAHCPLSNVFFAGSVFPLRRLLDAGVRVGLGTDIAGGASPSLLENARMSMLLSVQVGSAGVATSRVSILRLPMHRRRLGSIHTCRLNCAERLELASTLQQPFGSQQPRQPRRSIFQCAWAHFAKATALMPWHFLGAVRGPTCGFEWRRMER